MNTNYCFYYEAGLQQKILWVILSIFSVESTICMRDAKVWIFPIQTAAILLCPFMFPTNFTYSIFLQNASMNMYFKATIIVLFSTEKSYPHIVEFIKFIGYLHVLAIYIIHAGGYLHFSKTRIDFLEPYAISREVQHV